MSLHRHLTSAGSCASLPYRHDCPRCRAERLGGALPYPAGALSQRGRALLLATALGASSGSAAASLLDPPPAHSKLGPEEANPDDDDAGDGPSPEDHVTPDDGDPSQAPPIEDPDGPDQDRDGEIPGPGEPAPGPAAPPTQAPPVPAPPPQAPPGGVAPAPPPEETPTAPPLAAPPSKAPPSAVPPVETVPSQPTPHSGAPAPASPAPNSADNPQQRRDPRPDRGRPRHEGQARADIPERPSGERALGSPGASVRPPARTTSESASSPGAPSVGSVPTGPSSRLVHVVAPGESLWSIAQARLGVDAGPAAVARLVNRLWVLNADRIGTGRPDLILPGQRLLVP